MEQNDMKSGKRFLIKAVATRDQLRTVVQARLDTFKEMSTAADDEIAEFAASDPDTIRFMAMALVHEAALSTLQNTVDEIEKANE